MREDGAVLADRHVASDSDNGADDAAYDMDAATGRCVVRTVSKGVYGYHRLPLPANAQDGVSVLLAARSLARMHGSAVVPTAVDSMWWPTHLRTLGVETIRWRGREVRAVRMQSSSPSIAARAGSPGPSTSGSPTTIVPCPTASR